MRFGLVGACTVGVDFAVYQLLLAFAVSATPAKATSFVVATICAYVLNRSWTFRARGGRRTVVAFTLLYSITLGINVGVNAAMLELLPAIRFEVELAFLAAQATSSTINFLAMRQVIFRPSPA